MAENMFDGCRLDWNSIGSNNPMMWVLRQFVQQLCQCHASFPYGWFWLIDSIVGILMFASGLLLLLLLVTTVPVAVIDGWFFHARSNAYRWEFPLSS